MTKKNPVHVSAYIAGNLGDDLFIKILCERYSNVVFIMAGPRRYKRCFRNLKNLSYICDDTILFKLICKLINVIRKSLGKKAMYRDKMVKNFLASIYKTNVMITGSMFVETPTRLDELMMEEHWYNQGPIIIGCSFGPYKDKEYYHMFKEQFRKAKHICFRDRYSYELFNDLGNVSYAPDVVFNFEHENRDLGYYVISVMDLNKALNGAWKEYCSDYNKKIAEIICELSLQKRVVLLSFCEEQGDTDAINDILGITGENEKIKVCEYSKEGIDEVITLIANCQGIITTRLHSLILGILFKKKVYPIIYSDKIANILSDISVENKHLYIDSFVKKDCEEIQNGFIDTSVLDISNIRERSKEQFRVLDEVLKY